MVMKIYSTATIIAENGAKMIFAVSCTQANRLQYRKPSPVNKEVDDYHASKAESVQSNKHYPVIIRAFQPILRYRAAPQLLVLFSVSDKT